MRYGKAKMRDIPNYLTYERSFSLRNFPKQVVVETQRIDLKDDLSLAVEACRDERVLRKTMNLCSLAMSVFDTNFDYAVYSIEAVGHGHAKVGITKSPLGRLRTMQVANFAPLRFDALVWFDSEDEALAIERLVVEAAKEMGIHARGEWLQTSGLEVAQLILKAARYSGHPARDGEAQFTHLGDRLLAFQAGTAEAHSELEDKFAEDMISRIAALRS
jgi:hypothetical protein